MYGLALLALEAAKQSASNPAIRTGFCVAHTAINGALLYDQVIHTSSSVRDTAGASQEFGRAARKQTAKVNNKARYHLAVTKRRFSRDTTLHIQTTGHPTLG